MHLHSGMLPAAEGLWVGHQAESLSTQAGSSPRPRPERVQGQGGVAQLQGPAVKAGHNAAPLKQVWVVADLHHMCQGVLVCMNVG